MRNLILMVMSVCVLFSCSRHDSEVFDIEKEERPDSIITFQVGDYTAIIDDSFINVQMPYGTDVSKLQPTFTTTHLAEVYVGEELQTSAVSVQDFSMPVEYCVVSKDSIVNKYTVSISYSNIPVLYISTPVQIVDKENWVSGCTIYVTNAGEYNMIYETANLKGRGNSTWLYAKKPYAIKLDKKNEVLGMPKHKRWVLLANYIDRTCIRNSAAFEIARKATGMPWTPRGLFVDVVMNGVFLGNYYLCEQIKIDKNRVDISEIKSGDSGDEAISGGYLCELDKYYDEVNKFRTEIKDFPVNIKEPDDDVLLAKQFQYIQNYFNNLERTLYKENFPNNGEYRELIDINSFVDWWLVSELIQNGEPWWPKSTYMYKDRKGKLFAGPIWDLDYWTFRINYNRWLIKESVYYDQLFKDPYFVEVVKERWAMLKASLSGISAMVQDMAAKNRESVLYNNEIWPVTTSVNKDEDLSYDDAIARLIKSIDERMNWMSSKIDKL